MEKRFVYILRSTAHSGRRYVGLTSDVAERLHWHNNGPSGVTVHNRPWSLVVRRAVLDTADMSRMVFDADEHNLRRGSGPQAVQDNEAHVVE